MEEALDVSGKRVKRELIEALKEFIRKKRRDDVIRHAGSIQVEISLEELLRMGGELNEETFMAVSELGFPLRRKGITIPATDLIIVSSAENRMQFLPH